MINICLKAVKPVIKKLVNEPTELLVLCAIEIMYTKPV